MHVFVEPYLSRNDLQEHVGFHRIRGWGGRRRGSGVSRGDACMHHADQISHTYCWIDGLLQECEIPSCTYPRIVRYMVFLLLENPGSEHSFGRQYESSPKFSECLCVEGLQSSLRYHYHCSIVTGISSPSTRSRAGSADYGTTSRSTLCTAAALA